MLRVPPEITELLGACSGFDGTIDQVDFTGRDRCSSWARRFPTAFRSHTTALAISGLVDLHPHSTRWGPIYFVCHDAPVILYQSGSLEEFLTNCSACSNRRMKSLIDDVHEDRPARVWRTNPGVLSFEQCLRSGDPILSAFARELDDTFRIVDLRGAKPGDGFSWGRYGPNTRIKRFRTHAVFAYQKPRSSSPGS